MKKQFKKTGKMAVWMLAAMAAAGMTVSAGAQEKTFVYGTTSYGESMGTAGLNPHENYAGWSTLRYGVGETLFRYNDSMELEPWLASSYEFLDERTLQITLRDDVLFSNGKKMDGAAVKACLEHLVEVHDRAPSDLQIDHIEAEDQTVVIYTKSPAPALLHYLGDPYGAIIDMEAGIEGEGGSANVVGTGPYIAETVSPTEIHLVKNDAYWGGEVKVDQVVVKSYEDASALTASLQTGAVQGTYGLQYDNYVLFENPDYTIHSVATSRCFFGQFNFESEIMQDDAVRQAIAMGIDKEGFCSVIMAGRGIPAKGAFPDDFSFGNNAVSTVTYDPEGARKVLEDAGWIDEDGDGIREKDGKMLKINWLTYPTRLEQPKLAEYAQATLKDIGIEVEVNDTTNHKSYAESGEFDVYVSSITTAPTGDPEYFFTSTVTGVKNYGHYQDEEVTALVEELKQTFDEKTRGELAIKLQQKILDENAFFFVSHLNMGIVTKANVSGMEAHPCDYYEITADLDVE